MPNSRRPTTIQSVDRAAAILKALAGGPGRLGVSELADRLGLARPTVHGLLQTLLAQGFVEQDRVSEKYQLGAGLLQLGYSYLDVNELRSRSITYAAQLAVRTKFAVRVGVMHGPTAVVVHHVFRPDATLQILEVGSQLPLHASALGKALLAFAPERRHRQPAVGAAGAVDQANPERGRVAHPAEHHPPPGDRHRARRGGARRVQRRRADLRSRRQCRRRHRGGR